jgi:tripartite-type tricarboxylate transporter receptor subunit TctC
VGHVSGLGALDEAAEAASPALSFPLWHKATFQPRAGNLHAPAVRHRIVALRRNLCTMELPRREFLQMNGAAALALVFGPTYAQSWPTGSVRLLVGCAPDDGLSSIAHILADRLSETWNQRVIVENQPGDDPRIGFDIVAHAVPDGHTILLATGAPEINRFLYSNLNFDPTTDIAPVSLVGSSPDLIIVPNSSPLYTVEKFIAYAKSHPGVLHWASPGVGTQPHLAGELFALMTGIKMTHVAYDGITDSLIEDLVAGRVDAMFDCAGALLEPVRNHRVRGLAVTSARRFPNEPELPTVAESGVPGYDVSSWYALYVPAKTPPEIVDKLNTDIVFMLRESAVREKLSSLGVLAASSRSEELAARNSTDAAMWKKLIEVAHIKMD